MRKSLMMLVTLAGSVAFAAASYAGDSASQSSAVYADGGCGFSQAYLQAKIDEAEAVKQAETRAKVEALIDHALQSKETAAMPVGLPEKDG